MLIASSNFLVPNATIIVEIIAFLIVLLVIGKYVLPVVNGQLEQRQQEIKKALETADLAKVEAEKTRSERDQILSEARHQAREILAKATRQAEQVRDEAQTRGSNGWSRARGRRYPSNASVPWTS